MALPAKQPTRTNILDLLHKGIYPAVAIILTACGLSFVMYTHSVNTDKQRQIDALQAADQDRRRELAAVEKKLSDRVNLEETREHSFRVALCRKAKSHFNFSNSPAEEKAAHWVKVDYALTCAMLEQQEGKRIGEAKAKELWDRARSQATKAVKGGEVAWFFEG
jgi:hypothetical protein